MEPDEATLTSLCERRVAAVLITNRDHERASAAVASATGAVTIASVLDAPLLSAPVTRTVQPGDVVHGWTTIGLDGCKTAGEIALYDPSRSAAIVGDAIVGTPRHNDSFRFLVARRNLVEQNVEIGLNPWDLETAHDEPPRPPAPSYGIETSVRGNPIQPRPN